MPIPKGKVTEMATFIEGCQAGRDGFSWWDNPYAADSVRGKSVPRKEESWENACLWWKGYAEQKKVEMGQYVNDKITKLDQIQKILED